MFVFLLILTIAVFFLTLTVGAIKPARSSFSLFELKRRSEAGDKRAENALARELKAGSFLAIRDLGILILFGLLFILLVAAFDWASGFGLYVLAVLIYGFSASLNWFSGLARKMGDFFEKRTLRLLSEYPVLSKLFSGGRYEKKGETQIGSSFELMHLIGEAGTNVLTDDNKKLILNGTTFGEKTVSEIMTPRSEITCVKQNELLGPLVLDDLHKSGHRQILVIEESVDHIVGIMSLDKMLSLDQKRSVTAGKAVDQKAFYVRLDQTLEQALSVCLTAASRMLIVVNAEGQTVGLLTINDLVTALFGRKIASRLNFYDDPKAVAKRHLPN